MQNQRDICNETDLTLAITLYIQEGSNPSNIYGTINLKLRPGQSEAVEFGTLRNNALAGIHICPLPVNPGENYRGQVIARNDVMDQWLNNSSAIAITLERLEQLNGYRPFRVAK